MTARPTVAESLRYQARPLRMDITTGPNGPRLAFVDAAYFETVAEFATDREAQLARANASIALLRLNVIFRNTVRS